MFNVSNLLNLDGIIYLFIWVVFHGVWKAALWLEETSTNRLLADLPMYDQRGL